MASKAEAEKVRLECPLCLDNFENATLLTCGHTFCKKCLGEYDEQHNHDHLVCPVCRQTTKLGPNRVAGLTPNFSIKGVEDKINVDVGGKKTSFCRLHNTVYMDIFCVDCEIFICLSCYIDAHKDHKVIKKEEVGRNLRQKKDTLVTKSRTRKTQLEKYLYDTMQEDKDIHHHLNNLENDIRNAFVRKITILQENEELLLKRVDDLREQSDEQSKCFMTYYRQLIDNVNISIIALTDNVSDSSDLDTLQACHLQCHEIENSLKQTIDKEAMVHLKQAVRSTQFCAADDKLLALGQIEQGVQAAVSTMPCAETATGVRENIQAMQARSVRSSPTSNLKIVRKFDLPSRMVGLAALSQDAVVIGYGINRKGADCFYVSGDKKPHLRSEVGRVNDIALLTDGRSVVSQGTNSFLVYDRQGNILRGLTYTCMDGSRCSQLCSNQHNNIYAVNGISKVFIFHGYNTQPEQVDLSGNVMPMQICVTKTGVIITSSCTITPSKVTVFDREGHVGTTIISPDDTKEYLYAAVDSQDRVLVARMRSGSDTVELTRYTLQGLTLTEEVTFNQIKLHEPYQGFWSYMVSLRPNVIAFATYVTLYFIKIAA